MQAVRKGGRACEAVNVNSAQRRQKCLVSSNLALSKRGKTAMHDVPLGLSISTFSKRDERDRS